MPVNHVVKQLQDIFQKELDPLALSSGFLKRRSAITARAWVQGLVFGWLSNAEASVSALAGSLAAAGAQVTPQAVQQRFDEPGAVLLGLVLEQLTAYALGHGMLAGVAHRSERLEWLGVFPRIYIRDSTIITLPQALRDRGVGLGGFGGPSCGLKINVQWEWHSGHLLPLRLTRSSLHDQRAAEAQDEALREQGHRIQKGEMHLFDLGYFKLEWLKTLAAQGAYFCSRYKSGTYLVRSAESGVQMTSCLIDWLDQLPANQMFAEMAVSLGKNASLPCRLLAVRVLAENKIVFQDRLKAHCKRKQRVLSDERLELCGWVVLVTNAPREKLSLEQAFELYRLRWQIERLFRLWKETLKVDEWRTRQPHRIECEIYAKLMAALLTQEITAYAAWDDPARSLKKCAQIVALHARALLVHMRSRKELKRILQAIQDACLKAARIENRRKRPSTCQALRNAQGALA